MSSRVAVVVAKYQENTGWVSALPKRWEVFVYDKSRDYVNVGREAETYARFVMEHWDRLASWDFIVFLQGNPFDHLDSVPEPDDAIKAAVGLGAMLRCDGAGRPHHHVALPVEECHAALFPDLPPPEEWEFAVGGQYAVPTRAIAGLGRQFWTHLHAMLFDQKICAWTMERLWLSVFTRHTTTHVL